MTYNLTLRAKAHTSLSACTTRILRTFGLATDDQIGQGAAWYVDARRIVADIARDGGISTARAACVMAHLSPQTTWARNVAGARQLVRERRADHCMSANVTRALSAMDADDPWSTFGPDARKTRRFAMNMVGDDSVVTVDIWALRVAFGRGWGARWRQGDDDALVHVLKREGVYEAIERSYLNAARRLGMPATTVQAVTWGIARNGRYS